MIDNDRLKRLINMILEQEKSFLNERQLTEAAKVTKIKGIIEDEVKENEN